MALTERTALYTQIEAHTGNPLIVYVTSRRPNAAGIIAADSVDEFVRQIDKLPEQVDTLDILIESNGGDGLVVWRLISILRAKAKKLRVLVPHSAFSAATLFCLGADEVVMGRFGCLGPTDPQLTVVDKNGQQKLFAFEDVVAFIKLVKEKMSLKKETAKEIYNRLFDSVEPFSLGFASRSSELSTLMGTKLLQTHDDDNKHSLLGRWNAYLSKWKAQKISARLNTSYFNHSHPLNKDEVKEIGLKVTDPSTTLEDLMWKVHLDFEKEFLNDTPFDAISGYLQTHPALVPGGATVPFGDYSFTLKFVILESKHLGQEYAADYQCTVFRNQNLTYGAANTIVKQGWTRTVI